MTGFGFLFASDVFCLHPIFFRLHRDRFWFFVCILSFLFASDLFLFASDLFCLHPIFFVCSKPFFIALTLVGHRTGPKRQPRKLEMQISHHCLHSC